MTTSQIYETHMKIRSLIADKEMLVARANDQLHRCGEWNCDWNEPFTEINKEITGLFAELLDQNPRIQNKEEACIWTNNGYSWESGCGHDMGKIDFCDADFCPSCGLPVKEEGRA